jgi:hypothetical protein
MNAVCCVIFEGPRLSIQAVTDAGLVMLFMNAAVAFCLNVAVVFLVRPNPYSSNDRLAKPRPWY